MEGDNGLNTLECLRGRLLAERYASRVAKEEAESMTNKFVELERKLKEEIKLRDRAERKLTFLKKKLESFNMYCGSQFKGTSTFKDPNQSSEDLKNNENRLSLSSSKSLAKSYNSHGTDDYISNPSPTHASTKNICLNPNPSYEDLKNDESRLSSLSSKSSVIGNEDDHGDFVDNSLALVPVTLPATSQATSNHKPVNESVVEALDALKRARESLLCSKGTWLMIKVGTNLSSNKRQ